ncbi:mitogen-activated protein kinase kinase kinase 5 isoform X2 [Silene latifolia]|uniref:mitogen-activated protein kinase kinase kinase 5 isoform X2 n=1 Tax=Silene latifolia TaxID=37657 RepID=UPI003D7834F8
MLMPQLSSSSSSASSPTDNSNHKRRLTRAKQLRHLRDCDVKHLEFFLNSPTQHRHAAADNSSPPPSQPLPLPELSALLSSADKLVKERRRSKLKPLKSDCFRLPSPATILDRPSETTAWGVPHYGRRSVDMQQRLDAPPRVDSQRLLDTHHSVQRAETWSSRNVHQKTTIADQAQKNLCIDISSSSAPTSANTSPMVSPQRTLDGDLFSLYNEEPKRWSELAIPAGLPYTTREERNVVGCESNVVRCLSHHNSMFHIEPIKGLKPTRKSTSGPSSPRHPKLNIEISSFHNNSNLLMNVHPLPLPPPPASFGQASSIPQVATKSEHSPVKNQWTKGKLIGRGTFGSVYAATNRETGALCAMKEVELCSDDPKSQECMRQLEQEIKVLSHLKHPNIVQYYGSEIADDKFYIYLEYVYPGSINKYVHEHCGAITEAVVRNFTRHICSGLAYLHGRKTIHRDIKGANLLVDSSGVVKLADFGMAKHLTGQAAELSMKGSPYWMAPELMQSVLQKDNRSVLALAVDIWSLGCTVIEMLTGKPPWSEYEGAAAMFKVLKESPAIPETLSSEGKDFLNCCFRRNPADRPSASKLLEHSFLKNYQQLDVPNFGPTLSFNKLTDKAHSPRDIYHHKPDKVPMSPDRRVMSGKGGISENSVLPHPEINDTTKGRRHSPRSILEPVTSLSPPRLGPVPKHVVSLNTSTGMTSGANRNVFSGKLQA